MSLGQAFRLVMLANRIPPDAWPAVFAEASHFDRDRALAASFRALDLTAPPAVSDYAAPTSDSAAPEFKGSSSRVKMVAPPFLPTSSIVIERMLLLAEIQAQDLICDLGCGDGRIVIAAAKHHGARGVGIDHDPARIAEATACAVAAGVQDRVTFACGDLFAADLADATVVTCYLLPQLQPPLLAKLRREARPGTRIVSHEFTFPDWPPEKTAIVRTGPARVSQLYLWRLP
jgi:SAM-dependent methyltransferase